MPRVVGLADGTLSEKFRRNVIEKQELFNELVNIELRKMSQRVSTPLGVTLGLIVGGLITWACTIIAREYGFKLV